MTIEQAENIRIAAAEQRMAMEELANIECQSGQYDDEVDRLMAEINNPTE